MVLHGKFAGCVIIHSYDYDGLHDTMIVIEWHHYTTISFAIT